MAQQQQLSNLDYVDDLYFSATLMNNDPDEHEQQNDANDPLFPVSGEKYAQGLQFQEALMGSVLASQSKNTVTDTVDGDPPSVLTLEAGQSSHSFCEICAERKEADQMFAMDSCVHSFCSECVNKYAITKIQDSITVITCPGIDCRAVLDLDIYRPKLSKAVIDLWEEALCEEVISASERFYCPFTDCSALLVKDNCEGKEVIRESECPYCHRLFCAECKVAWHCGVECEEFQRLEDGREELMVIQMANDEKWSRCPGCRFFVERTGGCPHMVCRCKFEFCYGCGAQWTAYHGGCSRN